MIGPIPSNEVVRATHDSGVGHDRLDRRIRHPQKENAMTAPRRALIVVDVQQEYFNGILQIQAPSREKTLANIVAALDVARQKDLPVVVVQHQLPEGAPVFAVGSDSWSLHPAIEQQVEPSWKRITKDKGSVFAGTDVAAWLAEQNVDTVTIDGYMTNN